MKQTRTNLRFRLAIVALCFVLPSLSLIPLGGIWLWQQGYALHWVIGAAIFVVMAFLLQLYLFRRLDIPLKGAAQPPPPVDDVSASWTPREAEAWTAVQTIADTVDIDDLSSWDAFVSLGQRTVEAVAKSLHPEDKEPVWNFTVPEALTLIEQVNTNLRPVITDNIPFGDRLTVGQVLRVYRWRRAVDIAQKGYDIWRVIRMLNPATAATQELRERLSKQMYEWGREEVARRIAGGYVREVGRAAIDLYGGRLRVSAEDLAEHVSDASRKDRAASAKTLAEPLRILIAGPVKAGKSSLVNALLNEVRAAIDVLPATRENTAYQLKREGVPQALIFDSPGIQSLDDALDTLIEAARQSDLLLWVSSAVRPDRESEKRALAGIRADFAAHPNRRRPPMLLIMSHVDLLRPMQDWQPPYDIADTTNAKAVSIRGAMEAASADLGFRLEDIVPACLNPERGCYNIDAIWAEITERMPEAQRAQLVRVLREADKGWDWKRIRTQALNAGRVLSRSLTSRSQK